MKRKAYTAPILRTMRIVPVKMLTVSIIQDGTADPDADILVKSNNWNLFGDNDEAYSNDDDSFN